MRRTLTLMFALLGTLLLAASAQARDVNHDRIPDRWEKRHGLSLEHRQAKRDQDRDGFHNRAEWRAKTDPRNADSDGDGIEDGDENAGVVSAYDAATGDLTITLFDGGTLSGKVTDETDISCDDDATAMPARHGDDDDDRGDNDHGDDDRDDRDGDWGDRDEHSDRDDDHGDCDRGDCPPDALKLGAQVEEAELKATARGRVWTELELR